jgi:hypothetical protein
MYSYICRNEEVKERGRKGAYKRFIASALEETGMDAP